MWIEGDKERAIKRKMGLGCGNYIPSFMSPSKKAPTKTLSELNLSPGITKATKIKRGKKYSRKGRQGTGK